MPLRLRLVALLSVLVVLLAGAGVVLAGAAKRVEQNRVTVSEVLQPASVRSRALLVSLVDQETGQRGYVLTGNDSFLAPYRDGNRELPLRLAELREAFAGDRDMQAAVGAVEDAARTWRRVGALPEIDARRAGDAALAMTLVRNGRGKAAFDEVRARVNKLQTEIDVRAAAAQKEDAEDLALLRSIMVVTGMLIVLLLVTGTFLLRRWALLPVLALRHRMRAVAAGHLDEEVLASGPSEIRAIAGDAEAMRRRIVAELEAARGANEALVQHSPVVAALRRELLTGSTGGHAAVEVSGSVLPAEGVLAGDSWEALLRPDGTLAILVTDVSGHGAEAGLLAFGFRQRLNALLGTRLDLDEVVTTAARWTGTDDERFLSCLVVVVDPEQSEVRWVNAGHPAGVLMGQDRRVRQLLEPTGPLISSVSSGWVTGRAPLRARDLLVVCTDGVHEARSAEGEEFGEQRLLAVLHAVQQWAAAAAVAEVQAAVRRFAVDLRRDDVTCVAAVVQ